MSKLEDCCGRMNPDLLMERLCSNHRSLRDLAKNNRLELYHRASIAVRVGLRAAGMPAVSRVGTEEGVAVRLKERAGGSVGFAAASGG